VQIHRNYKSFFSWAAVEGFLCASCSWWWVSSDT